jgi:hypothetical protein
LKVAQRLPCRVSTVDVGHLNEEINAGLANLNFRSRLADLGAQAFASSPADFGKFVAECTDKGQGDPGGQHQGGMKPIVTELIFHCTRSTNFASCEAANIKVE